MEKNVAKDSRPLVRTLNILIHRYLPFLVISAILAYEFVFKVTNGVYGPRFFEAVAIIFVAIFLFGKRGKFQVLSICIGFVLCWGAYQYSISQCILFPLIILGFLLVLALISFFVAGKGDDSATLMTEKDLYSERVRDFRKISSYLSNHSVLAIDSPYGNGKSSVVEALRSKESEWRFITFGILSTTVENVEYCIVREIGRLLESEGIYSNPISKIKSFFSHDFAYCVGELLFESPSYEDQLKNFVADIRKLGKVIVLNFEDIDRVTDTNHLNKVFSICDSLLKYEAKEKDKYIKVIYQCNIKTLRELFGDKNGDRRYIEKYIPHSISLDTLAGNFFNYVKEKNVDKYGCIKKLNFNFLSARPMSVLAGHELPLLLDGHTVRGIEQILDKVNFTFENDDKFSIDNDDDVRAAVIFFITRYFFKDIYNALDKNKKMIDQRIIRYNDKKGEEYSKSLKEIWNEINTSYLPHDRSPSSIRDYVDIFFDEDTNKNAKENKDFLVIMFFLGFTDDDLLTPYSMNDEREEKFLLLLKEYSR